MSEKDSKNNAVEKGVCKKSIDPSSVIQEKPPTQPNQPNQEGVSQQPTTSKPPEDEGKK